MELFQLKQFVVSPTLVYLNLNSITAEKLLLATIAQESQGKHLDQRLSSDDTTLGPAIGIYQIEPRTHDDLYDNFVKYHPEFRVKLDRLAAEVPYRHMQLASNLWYATAIARLIYYRRPESLPSHKDIGAIWWYYKRFFNSLEGKATEQQFMTNYKWYVEPLYE